MILDNNFWYFEQALSKSFVDMIIKICEKEKKKQAEIDIEKRTYH